MRAVLAVFLLLAAATAVRADIIGIPPGSYINSFSVGAELTNAGHTVTATNLNNPIAVDTLFLDRAFAGLSGPQLTNVQNYLAGGGRIVTEFSSTNMWFNGKLASLAGNNVNGFYVDVSNVTVVDPAHPLVAGVALNFNGADPMQVYQAYTGLDPSIHVAIALSGTPYGTIPVAATASVNGGTAVMFFSDFGDFSPGNYNANDVKLLLNGVTFSNATEVPEPTSVCLWSAGVLGLVAARRWKRRAAA
jgi:hypothetical protein